MYVHSSDECVESAILFFLFNITPFFKIWSLILLKTTPVEKDGTMGTK